MNVLHMAPWSNDVVNYLLAYQTNPMFHPYTCNNGHVLYPTNEGWKCGQCEYTQDWCYAWHFQPAMKQSLWRTDGS